MPFRFIAILLPLSLVYGASSPCDLNADGQVNVVDVQGAINQALGILPCGVGDLDLNGACNVVDVQRFINAALGQECQAARVLYVDSALSSNCAANNYSFAYRSCTGTDGQGYSTVPPAIAAMQPGDTVMIREGVYKDPIVIQKSGTPTAHLQITAVPGENVVIDTSATPGAIGVWIQAQEFVDISGLIIRNAPNYGLKGSGSNHVTFRDSEVAFSGNGGVIFENASDIIVSDCRVHHNNQLAGASMMEAISMEMVIRFQVSNCKVFDNLKDGIVAKYGSAHGTIFGNTLYRNENNNIYIDGSSFISVFNNISHDAASTKAGIGIGVESTYNLAKTSSHDLWIYNNVLYGNGAGIWFWFESDALTWAKIYNVRIDNNTIADNTSNGWGGIYIINGTASTFGKGNTIRNNIFWNNTKLAGAKSIRDDVGVIGVFTITNNVFQKSEPSATYGSSSAILSQSPFVNASIHDYHLVNSSLARYIGTPDVNIATDLDGKPRPATPDAGAFQY